MSISTTRIKNRLSQHFYRPFKKNALSLSFLDKLDFIEDMEKSINKNLDSVLSGKKKDKHKGTDGE